MFFIRSREDVKTIGNIQKQNGTSGTFTGTFDLAPRTFEATTTWYERDSQPVFGVSADMQRGSEWYSMQLVIPDMGDSGTCVVSTTPNSLETAFVVYSILHRLQFFIGRTGFIKYEKYDNGKRVKGTYDFMCVLDKRFQGTFDVALTNAASHHR